SGAAHISHRAQFDSRFGTFHPARLAGKTLNFARFVSGPAPVLWSERSRSQGIFQEVFAFQAGFMAAFLAPKGPLESLPSRFGGPWIGLTLPPSSKPGSGHFGPVLLPPPAPRSF